MRKRRIKWKNSSLPHLTLASFDASHQQETKPEEEEEEEEEEERTNSCLPHSKSGTPLSSAYLIRR